MTSRPAALPAETGPPRRRRRRWPPLAAVVALAFLAFLAVLAVLAPVIAPHPPARVAMAMRLSPPVFAGGTWTYPLGTDSLGQDLLSRIIFGARVSLLVGVCAVLISGGLGVTLGLVAGYLGGALDDVIMRIAEIQLAFPTILLYIAAMATLGPGLEKIIIVIGVVGWVSYARIERGVVLAVREQEYVTAAQAMGARTGLILRRHVLPNTMAPMIIVASFSLATTVVTEASLSFLGLGVPPSIPSWGSLLADGRDYLRQGWWITTFPGLAIMTTVLAINVIGDWLRDALDPRLRV
ncbi:MAG: ABC transporter permease [Armatimonadota bacterium]|nr:ABC transporter permease [Armatimonadota bacterium]